MRPSERQLRQSMAESGYEEREIEYAVDSWADKVLQERIDSEVEERAKLREAARQASLRKLDSRKGGLADVADYRKSDGVILNLPEGVFGFARSYGMENQLAQAAMAIRWAIREGLLPLKTMEEGYEPQYRPS